MGGADQAAARPRRAGCSRSGAAGWRAVAGADGRRGRHVRPGDRRRVAAGGGPAGRGRRPVRGPRLGGIPDRPQAVCVPRRVRQGACGVVCGQQDREGDRRRPAAARRGRYRARPGHAGRRRSGAGFRRGPSSRGRWPAAGPGLLGPGSPGGQATPPRRRSPGSGWRPASAGDQQRRIRRAGDRELAPRQAGGREDPQAGRDRESAGRELDPGRPVAARHPAHLGAV